MQYKLIWRGSLWWLPNLKKKKELLTHYIWSGCCPDGVILPRLNWACRVHQHYWWYVRKVKITVYRLGQLDNEWPSLGSLGNEMLFLQFDEFATIFFLRRGKKNMRTMGFPPTGTDEEKVKLKLFQGLEVTLSWPFEKAVKLSISLII